SDLFHRINLRTIYCFHQQERNRYRLYWKIVKPSNFSKLSCQTNEVRHKTVGKAIVKIIEGKIVIIWYLLGRNLLNYLKILSAGIDRHKSYINDSISFDFSFPFIQLGRINSPISIFGKKPTPFRF